VRPAAAAIDPAGGYAYFATGTYPGRIVRVALASFTQAGTLTLAPELRGLASAVVDPQRGYAYFGGGNSQGAFIARLRLSDFSEAGTLVFPAWPSTGLTSAAVDSASGYAYFGTSVLRYSGYLDAVIRIDLNSFSAAGALGATATETGLVSAVIDPAGGQLYVGIETSPGQVLKIDLAGFSRAGLLMMKAENRLASAVIDTGAGYAYFGTRGVHPYPAPDQVIRLRLSDFIHAGTLALASGEHQVSSAVIDPQGGFAVLRHLGIRERPRPGRQSAAERLQPRGRARTRDWAAQRRRHRSGRRLCPTLPATLSRPRWRACGWPISHWRARSRSAPTRATSVRP
jgi:hypothetical protein